MFGASHACVFVNKRRYSVQFKEWRVDERCERVLDIGVAIYSTNVDLDPIALLLRERTADGDEKERGKDTEFVREIVVSVGVQMVQNELRHDFTGRLSLPL